MALSLAEDSGKFLSTVQVGITLVGILAGAFGGAELANKIAPYLDSVDWIKPNGKWIAMIAVVSAITYLSVVIGELIPKQLALANPERIAMLVARPMSFLAWVASPLVYTLENSGSLFLKLVGIRQGSEMVTEAELKATLAEGAASGAIEPSEHDMLRRIIRLGDRDVQSIMTHRMEVVFIDLDDTLEVIRQKVHDSGHSRYPVIHGDLTKILGVISSHDLLDEALNSSSMFRIEQRIREMPYLPENTNCLAALEIFKKSKVHMAMIVDEYGSAEGIITASDLMEAIVGIMPTNYSIDDEPLIVSRPDGSYLVDGMTPIEELFMVLGIEESNLDAEYHTIAGFLLSHFGRTPSPSEFIEALGYRFEVVDLDAWRIDKILVSRQNEIKS